MRCWTMAVLALSLGSMAEADEPSPEPILLNSRADGPHVSTVRARFVARPDVVLPGVRQCVPTRLTFEARADGLIKVIVAVPGHDHLEGVIEAKGDGQVHFHTPRGRGGSQTSILTPILRARFAGVREPRSKVTLLEKTLGALLGPIWNCDFTMTASCITLDNFVTGDLAVPGIGPVRLEFRPLSGNLRGLQLQVEANGFDPQTWTIEVDAEDRLWFDPGPQAGESRVTCDCKRIDVTLAIGDGVDDGHMAPSPNFHK